MAALLQRACFGRSVVVIKRVLLRMKEGRMMFGKVCGSGAERLPVFVAVTLSDP
jgi:hypothetical protein